MLTQDFVIDVSIFATITIFVCIYYYQKQKLSFIDESQIKIMLGNSNFQAPPKNNIDLEVIIRRLKVGNRVCLAIATLSALLSVFVLKDKLFIVGALVLVTILLTLAIMSNKKAKRKYTQVFHNGKLQSGIISKFKIRGERAEYKVATVHNDKVFWAPILDPDADFNHKEIVNIIFDELEPDYILINY